MSRQLSDREVLYILGDSSRYDLMACHFLGWPYGGPELAYHSGPAFTTGEGAVLWNAPGYGLFLAACYLLWGHTAWPVLVVQVLLSTGNCLLVMLLAYYLLRSARCAALAGGLCALSITSISLSCLLLTETLFFTLQTLGLLWLVMALRRGSTAWFIAAATAIGAATYVRAVSQFWPAMFIVLPIVVSMDFVSGTRKELLRKALMGAAVLGMIVGIWYVRNFNRHGVATFAETGVQGARYYWTARTLASLDPHKDIHDIRSEWRRDQVQRFGPSGTTFAEHHHEDKAVVMTALRNHPWAMTKCYLRNVLDNAMRGSDLHNLQLPQWSGLWNHRLLKSLQTRYAGALLMCLAAGGALVLLCSADPQRRSAGWILVFTYAYFIGISGFQFWTGSRVCFPAQMAAAVLVAAVFEPPARVAPTSANAQ